LEKVQHTLFEANLGCETLLINLLYNEMKNAPLSSLSKSPGLTIEYKIV